MVFVSVFTQRFAKKVTFIKKKLIKRLRTGQKLKKSVLIKKSKLFI